MRLLSNHGFCLILLFGVIVTRTGAPATAAEADLGPYFERLRSAPPAATNLRCQGYARGIMGPRFRGDDRLSGHTMQACASPHSP